jgi:Tat protein secretion system quality control protein TatD with DNase activity
MYQKSINLTEIRIKIYCLFFRNKVTRAQQERVFLAQLKIARETGMPIVIHCRDAEQSVFDILSEVCED